jgi:hypothetical protein
MGRSDKPDIDYRFVEHAKYSQAFIEELDLKDLKYRQEYFYTVEAYCMS